MSEKRCCLARLDVTKAKGELTQVSYCINNTIIDLNNLYRPNTKQICWTRQSRVKQKK